MDPMVRAAKEAPGHTRQVPIFPELWVELEGDTRLLAALGDALRRALAVRPAFYRVHVAGVGRCGEVVVRIDGMNGRLPLFFSGDELEPGYVLSVVRENIVKFAP